MSLRGRHPPVDAHRLTKRQGGCEAGGKFGATGPGVRGSATKEGCACHECQEMFFRVGRQHTHGKGVSEGVECRIFDSATWLRTDRSSWRSDASSPWVRRHTGGSWQDIHGTPVPRGSSRPKQIPQVSQAQRAVSTFLFFLQNFFYFFRMFSFFTFSFPLLSF